MAERTTQSLGDDAAFLPDARAGCVRVQALVRIRRSSRATEKLTYTDLLVKVVATALRLHPRLNASWQNGVIVTL